MPYTHDIFISYRRHPETLAWIKEHFFPLLELRVGFQLDRDPVVYVHEVTTQVPAGMTWPVELGEVLGSSRILVALWTKSYLHSKWCTEEFSQMLAREQVSGCRTPTNKFGLVVPVIIDGKSFPDELGYIQRLEIQEYFNTRMRRDSEKAERLADALSVHAPGFAGAIANAPEWREQWPREAAEALFNAFHRDESATQDHIPRFDRR